MPIEPTNIDCNYFEIQVAGRLSQERAEWLGLSLRVEMDKEGNPVSTLAGMISDQAALFGILSRIRDLGMKLLSVKRVDPDDQ